MKLIIKTKRHFGDHKIHLQGVQFEAHFVNAPTDTTDEYKAMHELAEIVRADCKDAGWYFGFGRFPESDSKSGGRETQEGDTPFSSRERALKARAASAENFARAYKRRIDEMRLVLVRNGLAVGDCLNT